MQTNQIIKATLNERRFYINQSKSKLLGSNELSFKNSLTEIPKPLANIITVLRVMFFVRRCIMLFIVANGIPLNAESRY